MLTPKIILASASPRRKELIGLTGMDVEIVPSAVSEDIETDDPKQLVLQLSQKKALDVAEHMESGTIVIGADTCVYVPEDDAGPDDDIPHGNVFANGQILGKPKSKEDAARMIRLFAGKKHIVYTGVTLAQFTHSSTRLNSKSFVEETSVFVYPMTEEEILAYVETGEPMDKAGAYGIQGAFCRYIERLEGDYFNVVGLPVSRLYQEMKEFQKSTL